MEAIITIGKVWIDKPYENIKETIMYVIGNSEFSIESKLCPTDDYKKLFQWFGVGLKQKTVARDVNEKNIDIAGIIVTRVAPQELKFEDSSEEAANQTIVQLTDALQHSGYTVVHTEVWNCSRKRCNIGGTESLV